MALAASFSIGTRSSFPENKAAGVWGWQFNTCPG